MATQLIIHHIDEVGSTQTEVRRLAGETSPGPVLLIARSQTRGRGRSGHGWITAPRALACSLLTEPRWPVALWGPIPLVAGLAARRAVESVMREPIGLKWPNDLVNERGKVGGVLVEASGGEIVVGLGLNLWWPDPPETMAAIAADDPGWAPADEVAAEWAHEIVAVLDGPPDRWGMDDYRRHCETLGTEIAWEPNGRGRAIDVAADGGLVVDTATGRRTLRSGAVRSVRPTTLPPGSNDDGDDRQ